MRNVLLAGVGGQGTVLGVHRTDATEARVVVLHLGQPIGRDVPATDPLQEVRHLRHRLGTAETGDQ